MPPPPSGWAKNLGTESCEEHSADSVTWATAREAVAAVSALAAADGKTAVFTVDATAMSYGTRNLAALDNPAAMLAGLLTMLMACTVGNIIMAVRAASSSVQSLGSCVQISQGSPQHHITAAPTAARRLRSSASRRRSSP